MVSIKSAHVARHERIEHLSAEQELMYFFNKLQAVMSIQTDKRDTPDVPENHKKFTKVRAKKSKDLEKYFSLVHRNVHL